MKFLKIDGLDFEVAESDAPYELNLKNAKKYCKNEGGRLPDDKELHQIGELYRAGKLEHINLTDGHYWSSTETYGGGSWIERFSDGNQGSLTKFYSCVVRCVRRCTI